MKNWISDFKSIKNPMRRKVNYMIGSEQEIYSKKVGVKGKIDCVVESENQLGIKSVTALELKTGNYVNAEHKGQVALYAYLLQEVFKSPGDEHILLYVMKNKDEQNYKIT